MRTQRQIFYSFLLIIAIPTLVVLFCMLHISTRLIQERTISASELVVQESVKRVDTLFANYRTASMQIYYNENIMEFLESNVGPRPLTEGNPVLDEILGSFVNADKYLMTAVLRTDNFLTMKGTDILGIHEYLDELRNQRDGSSGRLQWIPSRKLKSVFGLDAYYFGAVRTIRRNDKELAELLFLIRGEFFKDLYAGAIPQGSSRDLILAPDGKVVSSPDEGLIGTQVQDGGLREILSGSLGKNGYLVLHNQGDRDYRIFSRSEESGWYFIREIDEREILSGIIRMRQSLVLIIILFCAFLVFLSYLLSRGLSRPLKELASYLDGIGQNTAILPPPKSPLAGDEISKLEERLSAMLSRIQALIDEVSLKEKLKNQAELKALRNHISPHFIYNTLDTIRWMAVINKQDNIRNMVLALDRLMRYAADSDTTLIKLTEEMALIREYVLIQRMRYSDICLEIDISEEIGEKLVDKFILQTIVENCIVHGFRDYEGTGLIQIHAHMEENMLLISVEDNGRGMEAGEKGDGAHLHTGLESVHKRLTLNYGEAYGVSMESILGKGTTVTLRLPVLGGQDG